MNRCEENSSYSGTFHQKSATYELFEKKYAAMVGFSKFYLVTHTPDESLTEYIHSVNNEKTLIFWDATELANLSSRLGLAGWLLDKAS